MSCGIQYIYPFQDPNDGRNIINANFSQLCTLISELVVEANTGSTIVTGGTNIKIAETFSGTTPIYQVSVVDSPSVNGIVVSGDVSMRSGSLIVGTTSATTQINMNALAGSAISLNTDNGALVNSNISLLPTTGFAGGQTPINIATTNGSITFFYDGTLHTNSIRISAPSGSTYAQGLYIEDPLTSNTVKQETSGLTTNIRAQWQNKSGTIAYLGDLSGATDGLLNIIPSGTTVTVNLDYQYLVYGNLTLYGDMINYGQVVIINGALAISGGTFTNFGSILMQDLQLASIAVNKYAATLTPGPPNTPNTITHSLNTTDITIQMWDLTSGDAITALYNNRTTNSVDITFTSNPAGNVRIVILG